MVESQLRTNKVTDPGVLAAFLEVPREDFVPESLKGVAYVDDDLPLGQGRFLIEPMVLARLIQAAEIKPESRVLVVGDPTGYAAAIAARLSRSVTMLERGNAASPGPYDAIVIAGAVERVPQELGNRLAEHGKLVTVLRERGRTMGTGAIVTRAGSVLSHRPLFDAGTPFVPGLSPAAEFSF